MLLLLQEIDGLLLAHFVVRVLMSEAARRTNLPPRRLSFTGTLKVLRCRLPECPKSRPGLRRWYEDLLAEIAEEVLPERRERINPRVIKRKMSLSPNGSMLEVDVTSIMPKERREKLVFARKD